MRMWLAEDLKTGIKFWLNPQQAMSTIGYDEGLHMGSRPSPTEVEYAICEVESNRF